MKNIRKIITVVALLATPTVLQAQDIPSRQEDEKNIELQMESKLEKLEMQTAKSLSARSKVDKGACSQMLESANDYVKNEKIDKAIKLFSQIVEECGDNFGGAADLLKQCKSYKKCSTVQACNNYLDKWPKGIFAPKVRAKKTALENKQPGNDDSDNDGNRPPAFDLEEDTYKRCTTIEDCENYLDKFPNGKHKNEVVDKLLMLRKQKTDEAESEMQNQLLREQLEREAAQTAYMTIRKIDFINTDDNGNTLNQFNSTMYDSEIKYLSPRITYDGILDEQKHVVLYCKIINPDGSIERASGSPVGYTYSKTLWVRPGRGNTIQLPGWGSMSGNTYVPGNYKLEIWYEGNRIHQHTFTVREKTNTLSSGNWKSALRNSIQNATQHLSNDTYKGQTKNRHRSGMGIYAWEDGDYYIGQWLDSEKNGIGMQIIGGDEWEIPNCPYCKYYVGGWSGGIKSGTGACYDKLGNLLYSGPFSHGQPTGTYPMENNGNYKFESIEYSNGDIYLGETKNGQPHGIGIYIWQEGHTWCGNWSNGQGNGVGLYMDYEGSTPQLGRFSEF